MTTVRIRVDGKIRDVDVAYESCPAWGCFEGPRTTTHYAAGAVGGRTADEWSCNHRDAHGCPRDKHEVYPMRWRLRRGVWNEVKR